METIMLTEKLIKCAEAARALETKGTKITNYSVAEEMGEKVNTVTVLLNNHLKKNGLVEETDEVQMMTTETADGGSKTKPVKVFALTETGKNAQLQLKVAEDKAVELSENAKLALAAITKKDLALFQVADLLFEGNIRTATGVVVGLVKKGLVEKTDERVQREKDNGDIQMVNLYKRTSKEI